MTGAGHQVMDFMTLELTLTRHNKIHYSVVVLLARK